MTVAVTGASGQLGRLVAERLLATLEPSEVILVTRNPAGLGELAGRGAQVRQGDFADPATLPAAFADVERLLLISTDAVGDRVDGHVAAIDAAVAAGVGHLAYTSVSRPDPANPAGVVPDHIATEAAIRASGLTWTMLRNNLYSDMQVPSIQQAARAGALVTNTGTGGAAYVARADCAAAAAAVLTTAGHADQVYDVTGPTSVTADDLAALASRVAGRQIEVVAMDDDAYSAGLEQVGVPAPVAGLLTSFGAAIRDGWLDGVSDVVERVTGTAPATLSQVVDG
jgi:NAD(P)H dehydrogenase (quinone)